MEVRTKHVRSFHAVLTGCRPFNLSALFFTQKIAYTAQKRYQMKFDLKMNKNGESPLLNVLFVCAALIDSAADLTLMITS